MFISQLFICIVLCTISEVNTLNYPNCLDHYQIAQISNNFNRNFIELTTFLFSAEDDNLEQAAFQILTGAGSQSINNFLVDNRTRYMILIITVAFFCIVIFIIRTVFSKTACLLKFTDKDVTKIISPCLVILSIMVFSLSIVNVFISSEIQNNYDTTFCAMQKISSLMRQGDNSWQWKGILGYLQRIETHISLLQTINIMSNQYDESAQLLYNKIKENYNFTQDLIATYSQGSIQYQNQRITFKQLLPQFFDTNQSLQLVNQSLMSIIGITQTALNCQLSIKIAKLSSSDAALTLKTRKKYLEMEVSELQSTFSEVISNQRTFSNMEETSWFVFANKFFIVFTLIGSASYAVLIVLSSNKKQKIFDRLSDFLWFLNIFLIILGVYLLYCLFQLATKQTGNCQLFQKLKNSEDTYYNISQSSDNKQNLFHLLYPCIFGTGQFEDLAFTQESETIVSHVIGNFTHYNNIINPEHTQYLNGYMFKSVFTQAIQLIKEQQFNIRDSWPYLTVLLNQLNEITYKNSTLQNCYKHKWAFNREGCQGIDIILPLNNDLLIEDDIQTASQYCLLFYLESGAGSPEYFLTFSQFMSNYAQDRDNPYKNCDIALDRIQQLGRKITDIAHKKYLVLEAFKLDLVQRQQNLKNLLKIIRTNYLKKQKQYKYLSTSSHTIQFGKKSQKLWREAYTPQNNCTIIRTTIQSVFSIFCLNLRAGILKLYISTTLIIIIISLIVVIGLEYGFYKDLYDQINPESSEESQSEESLNQQGEKKYIDQFFKKTKKRK